MLPTHDTQWAKSYKGNVWRRINGIVLVVGQFKTSSDYWAMRDGKFLSGRFRSLDQAQCAAERNLDGDDSSNYDADEGGW